MTNDKQLCRVEFPTFVQMPTRWMDNDAYGHMNNIVHYALIDTAVTDWQSCLLYTSPSPRDLSTSRMPSSA